MNFKFRRTIPALLSLVMLLAALQLPSFAAGTKYEVEPTLPPRPIPPMTTMITTAP